MHTLMNRVKSHGEKYSYFTLNYDDKKSDNATCQTEIVNVNDSCQRGFYELTCL